MMSEQFKGETEIKDEQLDRLQKENEMLHKIIDQMNTTVNRMIDAFIIENGEI